MKTKILEVDPRNPKERDLEEAARTLEKGGLVIIPTETVYGIAADLTNKKVMERLSELKQRPEAKPFALIIAKKEKLEEFARSVPVAAYKLAEKFWPGPLTMVLKSATSGTVGLRMPDDKVALRIIELAGVPLVCPSANLAGRPAPKDFPGAIKDLEGKVELALNAGKPKLGTESTVVDLSVTPIKILREGAIKKEAIEDVVKKKTVLFICTGNSCRSVMAKALLEKKLKEKKRQDVEVISAGTMMHGGLGATDATMQVLCKEGIDVSAHCSQGFTKEMLRKTDLILVMEKLHEDRVLQLAPEVKNRVFLLKEFAKIKDDSLNVADPIGRSLEFYERTVNVIKEAVERIVGLI